MKTANADVGKKPVEYAKSRNLPIKPPAKKSIEEGMDKHQFIYRTTINNPAQRAAKPIQIQKISKMPIPIEQLKKLKVSLIGVEGVAYHSRNNIPARTTVKDITIERVLQPPHRAQVHRNGGSKRIYISSMLRQSTSIKK